jgi:hypothetical protein
LVVGLLLLPPLLLLPLLLPPGIQQWQLAPHDMLPAQS